MKVFLDISPEGDYIIMRYHYHRDLPRMMDQIPGATVKLKNKAPDEGETYYRVKATWDHALAIRRAFGSGVEMTAEMKAWGRSQKRQSGMLRKLAEAEDAELKLMPGLMPELYQLIDSGSTKTIQGVEKPALQKGKQLGKPRPFQKADIAFMAARKNSLNLNHPGLGKTIEVIGAIAESGKLEGSHLIVCPLVSKQTVWRYEWESWVRGVPMLVTPEGRTDRQAMLDEALAMHVAGQPFVLVVNPAMVKMKSEFVPCEYHEGNMCKVCSEAQGLQHRDSTGHRFVRGKKPKVHDMRTCEMGCVENLVPEYPELHSVDWDWFVMDEVQKMGVYDMGSMTYKGLMKIKHDYSTQLSGTPFGGKAINVYHLLHLMDPKEYSNKRTFAEMWLRVEADSSIYTSSHSVTFGELKSCHRHPGLMSDEDMDCELCDEIRKPFWDMMRSHAIRRTKKEYLPDLPDKIYQEIWVDMTPKQREQYEEFDESAELTIDEYQLGSVGVLAQYTRLKQFAGAVQEVEVLEEATIDHPAKYRLIPTFDSPKLPELRQLMEERGIWTNEPVGGGYEQMAIFSESAEMVKMVTSWLKEQGVAAEQLIGATKGVDRDSLQNHFQDPEDQLRVLVVSTQAAGVSITLDQASTVVFLDETWNPDDQEQAEDRCHRGSRIHQVNVIYIRTNDTVQEYIRTRVTSKAGVNSMILRVRKRLNDALGPNSQ